MYIRMCAFDWSRPIFRHKEPHLIGSISSAIWCIERKLVFKHAVMFASVNKTNNAHWRGSTNKSTYILYILYILDNLYRSLLCIFFYLYIYSLFDWNGERTFVRRPFAHAGEIIIVLSDARVGMKWNVIKWRTTLISLVHVAAFIAAVQWPFWFIRVHTLYSSPQPEPVRLHNYCIHFW